MWQSERIIQLWGLVMVVVQLCIGLPIDNVTSVNDFTSAYGKDILLLSKVADIKSNLKTSVDPCDNFYEHACGNWHLHNPASIFTQIVTDKFQSLAKAFDHRLQQLLVEPYSGNNVLEANVREFYNVCLITRIDDAYKAALVGIYKEFGEFPALLGDQWNEDNFNWWETVANIQHKYGKPIMLEVEVLGDIKNNTVNMVYVGRPDFPPSLRTKTMEVLQEVNTAHDLRHFLGLDKEEAKKLAKELTSFERKLIKGATDTRSNKGMSDLLRKVSVEELQGSYNDSLDVVKYLDLVLGTRDIQEIYINDYTYLENLFEIVYETPKRTVANYILWQLLQDFLIATEETKIKDTCLETTKKFFGKLTDHLVYARYRNQQAEAEIFEVWEEIRDTFRLQLEGEQFHWISNETRRYAIEKLDAMSLRINSYDDVDFIGTYGTKSYGKLDYVEIVQQILMQQAIKKLRRLHEPVISIEATEELSFTPAYNTLENSITIPVAFLQPRHFWSSEYPQALKYAIMGSLIGHELVHGFDDDGRKYDKLGNLYDWWDAKSLYNFEERRKCFSAQYHNYKFGGKYLPESMSQENIADNGGIKLAYAAYKRWLEKQKAHTPDIEERETLPQLEYTNLQLFFVYYAQLWCDDVNGLFRSIMATETKHAPSKYRVIGSLSNFQEFSWVFKCNQDAAMNPESKCSIY